MRTIVPVRLTVLICAILLSSSAGKTQSFSVANGKLEIGAGLGPMFFLGDLGGSKGTGKTFIKDVDLPLTKLNKGLYVNFYPAEWLGFRLAGNISHIEGDDAQTPNKGGRERSRLNRNLKFRSDLQEAYAALEIYPTVFFEQYDGLAHKIRPYFVGGAGVFHFNPQGEFIKPDGSTEWVDLQPLKLEGQGMSQYPTRKPYSLTQMNVLMGGGIKYYLNDKLYVGFEILHRKTFTDYIDDVSTEYIDPRFFDQYLAPAQAAQARQLMYRENILNPATSRQYINSQRGDPKQNDAYFSSLVRFGWRLGGDAMSKLTKKQLKCPVYY